MKNKSNAIVPYEPEQRPHSTPAARKPNKREGGSGKQKMSASSKGKDKEIVDEDSNKKKPKKGVSEFPDTHSRFSQIFKF